MQYKKYQGNSYNIYTIKTDRFKSCIINVVFRDNIENPDLIAELSMIKSMLVDNNKIYPKRRDLIIRCEELYSASFFASSHRLGKSFELDLGTEFINPEYVKEKNYLDEIIKFNFEMINKPNVTNDEFDLKTFNIVKQRMILAVERLKESGPKYAIKRALYNMDPTSLSSKYVEKEDYEKITPASLYKTYKNIINNSMCDVYVIGNLDMDEVVSKIKKYFNLKMIKNHNLDLYVENKKRKKMKAIKETADYLQGNLIVGYNVSNLDEKEKIAFRFFVNILGGGMNSILYQNLRVKNSLCYQVSPIYYKYDKLLFIHVAFDEQNYEDCLKLIKQSIKEMKDGKITEEDFERTKKSLEFSFKLSKDSINTIMDNYIISNLGEVPLIEDYERKIQEITLQDVVEVANKITDNFVYLLAKEGDK